MRRQAGHIFSLDTEPVDPGTLSDPYTPFLPEFTHGDLVPAGEPLDVMDFDMNSWSSTVEESFANTMQSENSIDAELQVLLEHINQPEEYQTNNNPTNTTLTSSAPGASPSSQLPSPEVPSVNSHTAPMIHPEHESYLCSWQLHSGVQCDHIAPDRPAFLRHLAEKHQVSGDSDATIICWLLDSQMGSACNTPIKRGKFPRHVDTHYRLHYHCQYCPAGKSFSRQDSWKKHIRSKHA